MFKKISALCLTLCLTVSLFVGCSSASFGNLYDDESKIVSTSDSYSSINSSQNQKKLSATASIEKMDGTRTLWSHNVKEEAEFDLSCTLTADKGKSKLVLIYPDDTLITLVEVDKSSDDASDEATTSVTLPLPEGKTRIKLVTDGGKSIEVSITATEHN